jgi:hypothetical protein
MITYRARSQGYVNISMLSIVCEWKVPQGSDLFSIRLEAVNFFCHSLHDAIRKRSASVALIDSPGSRKWKDSLTAC